MTAHKLHNDISECFFELEDNQLIIDYFFWLKKIRDTSITQLDDLEPNDLLLFSENKLERLIG